LKTLSDRDIEDLLVGGKVMGSGGPGPERIKPLIDRVLAQGKKFRLIRSQDLPDSEIAVITSTIGGGVTKEQAKKTQNLPRISEPAELVSFRLLSEYLGKEPYALFPTELGASSTPLTMALAATLDKPTVDCDCAGRGKPELTISTTNVAGVPVTPACIATPFGDSMYLKGVLNDTRAEDMLRSVAIASGGLCGLSRCPVDRAALVKGTIPETISWCIEIGSAIRRSSEPVEALLKATRGVKIFEGNIRSHTIEEHDAFTWGEMQVDGTQDFAGRKFRVWYKNENLISWVDGKPYATCPDAICVVDAETGMAISNWDKREARKGRRVTVVGVPAYETFRTKRGLEVFGPRHFGYDLDYRPVEQVLLPRKS
jgi:uncharacterized protein